MCQLAITVGMIALFLYHEPTQKWVMRHSELFWIAFAVTIVLIICMACCTNVRRKAPMNYIFLFLFTLAEAFLLSMAASTYKKEEVSVCLGTILTLETMYRSVWISLLRNAVQFYYI